MAKGFLYLVVIMDWVSRAVLAWRLSNTLGAEFCVDALEDALALAYRIGTDGYWLDVGTPRWMDRQVARNVTRALREYREEIIALIQQQRPQLRLVK